MQVGEDEGWKISFPCAILWMNDTKVIKWINLQAFLRNNVFT